MQVDTAVEMYDVTGDGLINFPEFVSMFCFSPVPVSMFYFSLVLTA